MNETYKRSIGLTLLSNLMSLVAVGLMLAVFKYFYRGTELSIIAIIIGVIGGLLAVSAFSDSRQQLTLQNDVIKFKSFKLKNPRSFAFGSLKTEKGKQDINQFELEYAKIQRLECGRDTLFWRQNLHITVDGMAVPIVVSNAMKNHKQLYSAIIKATQSAQPGVFVSKQLEKYIDK